MYCDNPYIKDGSAFGCGQCIPCRLNKRRIWTHRIILETNLHAANTFATLTYNDQHLPDDGSVKPRDLSLWLKRLRKEMSTRIRYYGCGEYGDISKRPHYHLALFGYPSCERGSTRGDYLKRGRSCCSACDKIHATWNKGSILLGELNETTAAYIAGYVTKKMTKIDDPRLEGRHPEFSRMSLKPGIGYDMVPEIASTILEYDLETMEDVPTQLQHGKRSIRSVDI